MTPPRFPPLEDAASLYAGVVMHARMKPASHRFSYRVFNLLIDVTRLGAANRMSRLFSVGQFNLASFHESDHGDGRGSLVDWVARCLRRAGSDWDGGSVQLLCYPRILGFVFNPISVYFCHRRDGALTALIYEVRNTFGEKHAYVAPLEPGEIGAAGVRQERDKQFYVSPFLDMPMRYRFRIRPPGDGVRLRILETDADGPILAAAFSGERRGLTGPTLVWLSLSIPFLTLKVVAGIHWEAMQLWFKGARFHPRPPAPQPLSFAPPARTAKEAA